MGACPTNRDASSRAAAAASFCRMLVGGPIHPPRDLCGIGDESVRQALGGRHPSHGCFAGMANRRHLATPIRADRALRCGGNFFVTVASSRRRGIRLCIRQSPTVPRVDGRQVKKEPPRHHERQERQERRIHKSPRQPSSNATWKRPFWQRGRIGIMPTADFMQTANAWANLALVWIGFGTLAGIVAKLIMPGAIRGGRSRRC